MIRIASRFCGPPDSGNGGYSAGLLAQQLSRAAEVTLRNPPPLERSLDVLTTAETAVLSEGERLIAEARVTALELDVPEAPSFERASELSQHYIGHKRHHFPTCFVCGPAREAGDGLRIFPGSEQAGSGVAAPWVADASLADRAGVIGTEVVWAALDCAGYFATGAPDYPLSLLGRMAAEVTRTPRAGEKCVVLGWSLGREGRKLYAGTAVFGEDQQLLGRARQTWIRVHSVFPGPISSRRPPLGTAP